MKTKLLFLLISIVSPYIYAQNNSIDDNVFKAYNNKYWQVNFTAGTTIDLRYSSSAPAARLLMTPPDVAPMIAMQLNHLFAKRIGWYANFQINFYKEKESSDANYTSEFVENLANYFFPGITVFHPSFDVGLLYRIEKNRFRFYPSLGIGNNYHLTRRSSSKTIKDDEGVPNYYQYKQHPSYFSLNAGITVNYIISHESFLIFKIAFQQPLQKSDVRLIQSVDGNEINNSYYETITAGRSLNISIGYGVNFGKR